MKKIISILSLILIVGAIAFLGYSIFRTSSIDNIEIDGNIQTVYFVNSTSAVNFNDSNLKITYKDGSVKLKKLTKNLVKVRDFTTSVVNDGEMKLTYKSFTLKLKYYVVWTGLYYMNSQTTYKYNGGTSVSTIKIGPFDAKVDDYNNDVSTTTEMIYFYDNGTCDYYSRPTSASVWYLDDGAYDKTFYYTITGDKIETHLGKDIIYEVYPVMSEDGEMTLTSVKNEFVNVGDSEFLKSKVEKKLCHYQMNTNRKLESGDVELYSPSANIKFKKDSDFSESTQEFYVIATQKYDNFLKIVYVRFNENMFSDFCGFDTSMATTYSTSICAICYYQGVAFEFNYEVYE